MQPELTSARLAEQLLLFTHLALSALDEGEIDEIGKLLERRQAVLNELTGRECDEETQRIIARVQEAEKTLKRRLEEDRTASVKQIHGLFLERRGLKAYTRAA